MRTAALVLATLVALSGAAASSAQAQALSADQADARCLLVLQFIARDPAQKEQASRGILFYLGRLSARGAISRIEPVMRAEGPKLSQQQAQAELTRCGGELNARSKDYQTVAQRLAASAAPAAAAPAKK
jgi:hypothetical protein